MDEDNNVRFLFDSTESNMFIYRPPNNVEQRANKETVAVKFSNNIHLHESFLIQFNVEYTPEDLECTPLGPALIIRTDQ